MEEIMSVILIEEKTFIKLARTMLDWDSLRSKDNEDKYYEVYKTLRKTNRTELIDKVYKLHVQNTKTYNKNYKKRNEVLKIDELFKGLISQETYALGNNKEQNTLKLIKSILYQIEGYEIDSFWTELEVAICKDIVYDSQEYKEAKAWLK
jgi:hypothetical protein